MKIFSLVSGCRIAWQEPGTEHRVTAGEGDGTWEGGGGGQLPQEDLGGQWLYPTLPCGQSILPTTRGKRKPNMGHKQSFSS